MRFQIKTIRQLQGRSVICNTHHYFMSFNSLSYFATLPKYQKWHNSKTPNSIQVKLKFVSMFIIQKLNLTLGYSYESEWSQFLEKFKSRDLKLRVCTSINSSVKTCVLFVLFIFYFIFCHGKKKNVLKLDTTTQKRLVFFAR